MLPLSFHNRIEALITDYRDRQSLILARQHLTNRYRAARTDDNMRAKGFISAAEAISYVATRLPATFAAIQNVLHYTQVERVLSVLDIGAGPGTAALAAALHWPECTKLHLIEENTFMSTLSAQLLKDIPEIRGQSFTFQTGDFLNLKIDCSWQIVILAYTLIELSPADQKHMVLKAWEVASKGLIITMPGTPAAYHDLMNIRKWLIEVGAFIAAPCSHDKPCPLKGDDWCNFSVRLTRPVFHRNIKETSLPYEDEKFSYLIAVKESCLVSGSRIIRKPLKRTGHITLDLCTPQGQIERQIISKRHKDIYKKAVKAS
jgi:ribosomal protein RSM22 (predicted rRNA methylase)